MLTGESKQRLEGGHGCTAPVEPEDELVEVVGQVFPAHVAVSAPEQRWEGGPKAHAGLCRLSSVLGRSLRHGREQHLLIPGHEGVSFAEQLLQENPA